MGDAVPDEDLPTSNAVPDEDLPDTNQPDDTSIPEFSAKTKGILGGATELAGSAIANIPHAAAHGVQDLYRRLTGGNPDAPDNAFVQSLQVPVGDKGKQLASDVSSVLTKRNNLPNQPDDTAIPEFNDTTRDVLGNTFDVAGDVGAIAPVAGAASKLIPATRNAVIASRAAADARIPAPQPAFTPEEAVANTSASGSMGAAGTAADLSVAPPQLRTAISQAAQKTGGAVHPVALDRHLDTAQLPLPEGSDPLQLRKGQATGDAQQISDEKNLRTDRDTQGILSDSIDDQDTKLGQSMGEIRRRATPDIVQRNNLEHDQASIDAIKTQDNALTLDKRAKYQALTDANGGSVPIDSGSAISTIDSQLGHNYLSEVANESSSIRPILNDLRSGNPITFERFENARTNLATLQRTNTPEGVAAGIVRNTLENMPLPPEAAPLKGLADQARSAAKTQFDLSRDNPAYDAAVNDNVPKNKGLHVIGAPSPLAGNFLDTYATGNGKVASPALVKRLKTAVPDPVLAQSIEGHALNKLSSAAGVDSLGSGSFRNASFKNAVDAMAPKANALLSPDTIDNIERLKRVSGYVNNESKASSTNRSNTMLALQRFGAVGTDVPSTAAGLVGHGLDAAGDFAAAHVAGPVGVGAKRLTQGILKNSKDAKAVQAMKDAKLKFALDATKPGAGLDHLPTAPPRVQRASGGKVDRHEELVQKLMNRWRAAKKATDKTTKPLLHVSDNTIAKALEIAGNAL
jgi:hypothetical protein